MKVKNTSPGAVDCYSYNKQHRNKFLMLAVSRSLHLAPIIIDSETFLDETSYTYWICHDNFTTVAFCDAVTYFSSSVEHSKAVFWWAQNSHISDFSLRIINTLSGEANLHKKKSIKIKKKTTTIFSPSLLELLTLYTVSEKRDSHIQWTLVTMTTFVPKDVAIKMNLLLFVILNEQIDM